MVCKNCGKELNDGVKFCAGCGSAVSADEVLQQPTPVNSPDPMQIHAPVSKPAPAEKKKTPFFKIWWLWAILSLILAVALVITNIGIFDSKSKSSKDDDDDNDKPKTTASEASAELTTDAYFEEITEEATSETPVIPVMTPAELESILATMPLTVIETKLLPGDPDYPSLYPDIISAVVKNNSGTDVKSYVVAFVAWDPHNLPAKIIGQYDFNGGSYVKKCNYDAVNLVDGHSYGNGVGLALDEDCENITTIKAIVVSYEDFDGNTWNNPYYDTWVNTYSEKRLAE